MELILTQDVKGLGKKGEKVKASDGYARNFLLPKGIAVEVNAQTLTELKNREASNQHKIDVDIQTANDTKAILEGKTVKVKAKAGSAGRLFGSVTSKDVAAAIKEQFGIEIDRRKLSVDDIKQFGSYPAEIKLYSGISCKITVTVGEE
jgi:large subunit ribosomal protein L9